MSFSYVLTKSVLPEWRRLDADLQESVLHAIEGMLQNPPERDELGESNLFVHVELRRF